MGFDQQMNEMLDQYVTENRRRLTEIIADLVRVPSENTPPTGSERKCQEYVAGILRSQGWEPVIYSLGDVDGLQSHPLYWPGRDYTDRPNVAACRSGNGRGASLILSGHIDTVPKGAQLWSRDPFGGEMEGDRLYGRGSNDMKGGIGIYLFVLEALQDLGLKLHGDLIFESVVDEEFGGVNGTLAGRLMGFNADAAIIAEPTFLKVCPAQRGGRLVHLTFQAAGGILSQNQSGRGVVDQVRHFLTALPEFAARRRQNVRVHELYAHLEDPVPVTVTKLFTGPWGSGEPVGIPEACRIEVYWQTMPGEEQAEVEGEFHDWLTRLVAFAPEIYPRKPKVEFPIRWLPASAIPRSDPLITHFSECAARVMGLQPPIVGMEAPCDMYVFHSFGIPAILWGPRGGNTHAADEYLEIGSAVTTARVLLSFLCRWCGVA